MRGPVSDWNKLFAVGGIIVGLLLLMVGAILVDLSQANPLPGESQESIINRQNLGRVWGPLVAHIGAFALVGGLFFAAFFWEAADPFARLFLLILGVLALLLVLASSPTLFG